MANISMLPLPEKLSGVCHLATGTGKSYVMFAVSHLSILLGQVKRVLVLGPSSTVISVSSITFRRKGLMTSFLWSK